MLNSFKKFHSFAMLSLLFHFIFYIILHFVCSNNVHKIFPMGKSYEKSLTQTLTHSHPVRCIQHTTRYSKKERRNNVTCFTCQLDCDLKKNKTKTTVDIVRKKTANGIKTVMKAVRNKKEKKNERGSEKQATITKVMSLNVSSFFFLSFFPLFRFPTICTLSKLICFIL